MVGENFPNAILCAINPTQTGLELNQGHGS